MSDSVPGQLRAALPSTARVTSFAADGFTSGNVLNGARPMLSAVAWAAAGEPFPGAHRSVLHPLDQLEQLAEPASHVLVSVGGNDVREILGAMHRLPEIVGTFHANYRAICDRVLGAAASPKLILMLQYQVCLTHEKGGYGVYGAMASLPGPGNGQQKLQAVMERIYRPVLAMATDRNLCVIDLPRTFDPADAGRYPALSNRESAREH